MKTAVVVLLLFFLADVQGQVPADWDKWLEDGIVADDNSEYKEAERLLGQACDLSLVQAVGSERLTRACLKPAATHAVRARYEQASSVLEELVEALGSDRDARAVDRVNALMEAADVASARGGFFLSSEHLDEAGKLAQGLGWIDQALVLKRVALYHTSKSTRNKGSSLLLGAAATLRKVEDQDNIDFLRAAVQVGRPLLAFKLYTQVWQFLELVVERGRSRAEGVRAYDELWEQYRTAAFIAQRALTKVDKDRAELLSRELETWPSRPKDGVSMPTLAAKVEPSFTRGANSAGAQGVVVLSLEVWPDGRAHNIEPVESLPYGLTWEAIRAIRRWKFAPGTLGGKPVKVQSQIEFNFSRR